MGKYKELAADIVAHVGGKENVTGLRHCFTRLRFNLADDKKADTAYLKNRDGVISVVNSGGEYMVVIGEHVHDVYLDVCEVLGVDAGDSGQVKNSDASAAQKKNPLMQEYMIEKNKDFAPEFAQSLSLADEVVLMNIYPAREKPIPNVSSNIIMDKITVPVRLMTESEIVEAAPGFKGIAITMGAVNIDKLPSKIYAKLNAVKSAA